MAAKKSAKKSAAKIATKFATKSAMNSAMKSAKKAVKKAASKGGTPCTLKRLCRYVKELGVFLEWFNGDYKKLRTAMCNVEKQAWGEAGATMAKRFCASGPNDPPDPVKAPIWT